MRHFLFGLLILLTQSAFALSNKAEISVLTCSPGPELYESFGHTAIRIKDPVLNIDEVFNYGIFSYGDENFYVNFAKGFLWYRLGAESYDRFLRIYGRDKRTVTEQVLDLNDEAKESLAAFLEWNIKPENRRYQYHYFLDNCASRVMDVLDQETGLQISWEAQPSLKRYTYRDMVHTYTPNHKWYRLGIDLCLGMPTDREMTNREFAFLPDYLLQAIDSAYIVDGQTKTPLVKEKHNLLVGAKDEPAFDLGHPSIMLNLVWGLLLFITIYGCRKGKRLKGIEYTLFILLGLLGFFMLGMWFLTEHQHCEWNLNLLWANPLNLFMVFAQGKGWAKYYFRINMIVVLAIFLLWWVFPQEYNLALLGLMPLLAIRSKILGEVNIGCGSSCETPSQSSVPS